ncbi:SDR family oxidoreductase [Arthrobacter glacialis]|uniref:SDR family oxidoreductase n=1 Tax=Arthrobacter glacialis TaxID=1664 RepID=UPI001A9CA33D|nr:SDR family oxidoreductase [Arthrobacter glacialis]
MTGAASGIGRACAWAVHQENHPADVLVLADLDMPGLAELAKDLTGRRIIAVPTDVSDPVSVDILFSLIAERPEPLGAVIHAAGVLATGSALSAGIDAWRRTMAVNADGTFLIVTSAARLLMDSTGANRALVLIGSNAAGVPRASMPLYSASKAAAAALLRCVGLELAPHGIRANTVCPGSTNTAMQRDFWGDDQVAGEQSVLTGDLAQFRVGIPLGRMAQPEDIANAAVFLLSEQARHITMQDIYVDGGATLRA